MFNEPQQASNLLDACMPWDGQGLHDRAAMPPTAAFLLLKRTIQSLYAALMNTPWQPELCSAMSRSIGIAVLKPSADPWLSMKGHRLCIPGVSTHTCRAAADHSSTMLSTGPFFRECAQRGVPASAQACTRKIGFHGFDVPNQPDSWGLAVCRSTHRAALVSMLTTRRGWSCTP